MNAETIIFKGANRGDIKGWQAVTVYPMEGGRELEIKTNKNTFNGGQLETRATVFECYNERGISWRRHAFSFGAAGGDFSQRIFSESDRCTEKTVRDQHSRALAMAADIMTKAAKHYERETVAA